MKNTKKWKKHKNKYGYRESNLLREKTRKLSFVFLGIAGTILVAAIVFFILAMVLKESIYTIILAILFGVFVLFTATSIYVYLRHSFISHFNNLYDKTNENYNKIANFEGNLNYYEHGDTVKEFQLLNDKIDEINSFFNSSMIMPVSVDYDKIALEYVEPENKKLITLDSFIKYHKDFVLQTELFRNAFIFFYYNVQEGFMTDEDYQLLYNNIIEEFDGDQILLAKDEKKSGYLLFLPFIDSLTCLEERLNKMAERSIITKHEAGGTNVATCRIACVIYPYSDVKDILPDLRYATRQEKNVNVYIPKRMNQSDRQLYHTSLNLNNISRLFESLAKSQLNDHNINKNKENYQKILRILADHMGFETVGIAVYDENKHYYKIDYETSKENQQPLFLREGFLDNELVERLTQYCDSDSSFYFSKRSNVNYEIGIKLDVFAIKSGFFYLVRTKDGIQDVIYYLNREKDEIFVNAYDKESIVVFSAYIAEFSRQINSETNIHLTERRYRSILRITDHNLYTIDRETYELSELSDGLMDAFGELKRGDLCYKKLYSLDAPCNDCPLRHKEKKISKIGAKRYSTSLILERKKEDYPTLLLSPLDRETGTAMNRYDSHILIHSTYGFIERLNNLFYAQNRGYILFAHIDNFQELLEKYGEEGVQTRLRFFFRNYRLDHKFGDGEVYAYRDNIFAFVFPEEGRLDILSRCETIYDISQMRFDPKDNKEISLECTYIGLEYPQTYNNRVEFTRHFEKYLKDNKKMLNQGLFILPDTNYVRVASHEKFVLSLLDNALQSESISIKYLPECRGSANRIVGAELLLRLTDKYTNTVLNPYMFIPIASKNNRIGNITNYLIKHVGEIYQKYGLTAFKLAGMRNLSLNIDTTYFDDPDFLDKIGSLAERFHLPKGFIHFEFNEKDLSEHFDLMKSLASKIRRLDIYLTTDDYTGEFISINKLKELGFEGIKISRKLISNITEDPSRVTSLKFIIDSINEFGLDYCLVGLENKLQYQLISEIDPDFVAEGYYFYEPLDLEVLLDKLRQTII